HLDMDAFYASVELLRYPQLVGQPVVIGGGRRHQPEAQPNGRLRFATLQSYVGRGVITTATYAARAFGLHSGMGLMKAAKLAPHAVLLPTDFDEYRRFSRRFKAAVAELAPVIEDRGIDEIYIDLSQIDGIDADHGAAMAAAIKARVKSATGLSCSIGVTPNKLLSKLASELEKPDGLTILREADLEHRIWPLPARRINGIGPKAAARLEAEFGIRTIGELAATPPHALVEHFGHHYGAWLHAVAHGRDERPVVTEQASTSISRETTFERDLHAVRDRATLTPIFTRLCEQLAADLQRHRLEARTIGVKLRYDDFRILTRVQTLPLATAQAATIRRSAGECLKRAPLDRRLRLLGVRASGLQAIGSPASLTLPQTADLFA
ncbi:MAG: hypothetical protein RLZZ598_37, partial [Pseudomonadota bacterium]